MSRDASAAEKVHQSWKEGRAFHAGPGPSDSEGRDVMGTGDPSSLLFYLDPCVFRSVLFRPIYFGIFQVSFYY